MCGFNEISLNNSNQFLNFTKTFPLHFPIPVTFAAKASATVLLWTPWKPLSLNSRTHNVPSLCLFDILSSLAGTQGTWLMRVMGSSIS